MLTNELVFGQLAYIIPSILLYIVEIYVMFFGVRKSQFNTSFNKLFFIYAVNNIVADVLYYFFFRLNALPILFGFFEQFSHFRILTVTLWQVLLHTSLTTNLLDLLLSFNRFTAIAIPLQYKAFWVGRIKLIMVFIIIFPCICFWNMSFQETTFVYYNISKTYNMFPKKSSPIPWPFHTTILGACVTIACVGCLLCNISVGIMLCRLKDHTSDQKYTQDKFYFVFIMCVFTNQFLSCSTQVTLLRNSWKENKF